nr:MAG TPA: FlaG protein [Caudoviricetes sp.]
MIRKKLIYTVLTVLVTNVQTYKTKEVELRFLGKSSDRKIKNAIKEFSDEVMKVVQVIDTDEVEVVREMSIEDFIEHSEIVED